LMASYETWRYMSKIYNTHMKHKVILEFGVMQRILLT
jgi:hypothetical protein